MNFELVPCGDRGLLVRFGDAIDEATNRRVLGLAQALSHPALIDVIPTYASVLIEYDPIRLRYDDLCELVLRAAALSRTAQQEGQTVEIPVVYDGPDLAEVARLTGLTEAEVVARHTAEPYRVYGLGFSPGFPYLGGLDPALAVPRLGEPRVKVPAGSVGIGGEQTGIYPQAGPGGWHLIGRTGVALFDPRRAKPSLLAPGDTVRFVQVDEAPVEAPAPPPPVSERGPGLKVIKPGLLTTVQDLGRRGWQHLGVSVAGAVDYWALMVGNWLVANRSRTAALEITLQGPELAFTGPAAFAITGAPIPAELVPAGGGSPLPLEPWVSYLAGPGDLLRFGSAPVGCRSYLCVAGGFDLPPVLGSLSQDLFGGLGPLPGPLAAGDFVPFGEPLLPPGYLAGRRLPPDALDRYGEAFAGRLTARVVAGPQADLVQPEGLATLYGQPFTVGAQSDRQGLRLEGPPIQLQPGAGDLLSEGMPPGGLQVTADGRLMLMLVNRQTAGGYPKPAVAVYSDLPLVGQLRPGSTLRFAEVDLAEAHQIAWGQRRELAQVRRYLQREAIGLHGTEAGQKPQPAIAAQPAVRPTQAGVSTAAAPSSEPRRFMVRIGGTQFEVQVVEEKS